MYNVYKTINKTSSLKYDLFLISKEIIVFLIDCILQSFNKKLKNKYINTIIVLQKLRSVIL